MERRITIYLAPIRGITDPVFREALFTHFVGYDVALAPFVKTSHKPVGPADFGRLSFSQRGVPIIPQLLGRQADDFLRYAAVLCEMGAESVNWNLGCPHPVVTKKRLGSGFLPYPDDIDRFLDQVCAQLPIPLSIKFRLGLDDATQWQPLLPIFNRYPLRELIIHPRLGTQQYRGQVDLEQCEQLIEQCRHPIVYNGDIDSDESFRRVARRFGQVSCWMLGRGAVSNPALAQQIASASPAPPDLKARLRRLHDQCYDAYRSLLSGDTHLILKMKQLWQYWQPTLELSPAQTKALKKANRASDYERLVEQLW